MVMVDAVVIALHIKCRRNGEAGMQGLRDQMSSLNVMPAEGYYLARVAQQPPTLRALGDLSCLGKEARITESTVGSAVCPRKGHADMRPSRYSTCVVRVRLNQVPLTLNTP